MYLVEEMFFNPTYDLAHFLQLWLDERARRPREMANVIEAEVVQHGHVPVGGRQLVVQVASHVVIHLERDAALKARYSHRMLLFLIYLCVVRHKERRRSVLPDKVAGEELEPGVVAKHGEVESVVSPLSQQAVLGKSGGAEIEHHVDKAGDAARGQSLVTTSSNSSNS